MPTEDPGWWKAIRAMPAGLSPQLSRRFLRRQPSLVLYRGMILWSIFSSGLFYSVLTAINHGDSAKRTSPLVFVFLGFLVGDVVMLVRARRRPFWALSKKQTVPTDVTELAVRYRAYFFISWALTNAIVLYGFVAFFMVAKHKLAIYLGAAVLGAIGMILLAPTRNRVDGQAVQLLHAGSPLSLRDALMIPSGDLPQTSRRSRK